MAGKHCLMVILLGLSTVAASFPALSGTAAARIQPADLTYVGAFRLPGSGWEWSNWSAAATSYPAGDPGGAADGYPGSLFAVGHDHNQYVSEVSIPVPVISATKNVNDLNTAVELTPFTDIKNGLYPSIEMPRVGLEYLSAQGSQTSGKLHFSWAQHLDEGNTGPTHGWCELDLSGSVGTWRIGGRTNYVTADYIFEIPSAWSSAYAPGYRLATGRYRDGGQDAQGPALFTYGPWNQGNPPADGTTLTTIPLLLYDNVIDPAPQQTLNSYAHSDEWNGGAWLTAGNDSAVIFVGNKGVGYTWYGCDDGQECPPNCDCGESRGWWSDRIEAHIIFYDPADLARVAQGSLGANQPQPFTTLNIDPYLYHISSTRQKHHVSAVAFDRDHGLVYIFEPFADGDKPIVHVWRVSGASAPPGSPGETIITPAISLLLDTSTLFQDDLSEDPGICSFDCAANPSRANGWQTSLASKWEWGQPACWHLFEGHTGENVISYNLDGNYDPDMGPVSLRSPVINCSGKDTVTLEFWRWLEVSSHTFDQAIVQVSNGDGTWHTVWENPSELLRDTEWTRVELDISEWAASEPTVTIRWVMGPTSSVVEYCGWNFDDIRVIGQ